jgi:acetoin utilization protein AcuB
MNQTTLRVERHMSICPFTIGEEQPLIHAHLLMRAHDIRHLPVLRQGKLVGVLSERDLHVAEAVRKVDPEEVRVEEVMATNVYAVSRDTPLAEVVHEMAQHKYGSVVVVDSDRVIGMFTAVDAMEAFSRVLSTQPEH